MHLYYVQTFTKTAIVRIIEFTLCIGILYRLSVVIAILSELDTSFQEEEMIQMHFDTKATNY